MVLRIDCAANFAYSHCAFVCWLCAVLGKPFMNEPGEIAHSVWNQIPYQIARESKALVLKLLHFNKKQSEPGYSIIISLSGRHITDKLAVILFLTSEILDKGVRGLKSTSCEPNSPQQSIVDQ